jgi:protein TonB
MNASAVVMHLHHDILLGQPMSQRFAFRALAIAIGLHIFTIGAYYFGAIQSESDETGAVTVRIMRYTDLGPPPSLASATAPPVAAAGLQPAKPTVGIPVPVPDAEVSPEQTIATQTELSQITSPVVEQAGGEGVRIEAPVIGDEEMPDINAFIPVEKEPQVVRGVKPEYPEIARRAGIEGVVWVKILVDKEGKPRKAVVIKSEAGEVLNQAAVSAAMQFLFTPAIMNQGPVSCWVVIPFRFQLKEAPRA